jgi:hypothetical protein
MASDLTKEIDSLSKIQAGIPVELCPEAKNSDQSIGKSSIQNDDGTSVAVSVLSYEYLVVIFDILAAQKQIPFKYPETGCYARAHEMVRILDSKGITSAKIFMDGDLRLTTNNSPKGFVEWSYHVAPVVKVKINGKEEVYVIDPSIFDRPVPVNEWYKLLKYNKAPAFTYYTSRFNFKTDDKMEIRSEYKNKDLKETKTKMEEFLKIQEQRALGK